MSLLLALTAIPLVQGVYLQRPLVRSSPRHAAVRAGAGFKGTVPAPVAAVTDPWLQSAVEVRLPVPAGLEALREEATAAVLEARRPGRKDEAWRRTDLSSLFGAALGPPSGALDPAFAAAVLDTAGDATAAVRVVFVDGVFSAELSDVSAMPAGCYAGPLAGAGAAAPAAALTGMTAALHELPEKGADHRTELGAYAFGALNQASLTDVACVYVPRDVKVAPPVKLVLLSTSAGAGGALAASHPNVLVWMEERSELRLLQQYAGEGAYFVNALTRLRLSPNATLSHAYVQEQSADAVHIDSVLAKCESGARYESQLVQMGGRIARVNLGVDLAGRHAHTALRGIALASGNQLSALHSAVRHSSPDCSSEQEQRNAVAGRSRVVFRGAVQVPIGSDNTTANQLCRSLLLSDLARLDVSPNLEILTDDIVCTHGATVSDLDDEMIFYLQSRGLARSQARVLMLEGWARSIMDSVPSAGASRRVTAKAAELAEEDALRIVRKARMSSI